MNPENPDKCVSLYIHVPFCRRLCPYCDFYSVALSKGTREAARRFPGDLLHEVSLLLEAHPRARGSILATVYFGGGTPSVLPPRAPQTILEGLRRHDFRMAPDAEITLEANPETITPARLRGWRAAGINRVSLGAQSFDDTLLRRIGRGHTAGDVRRCIRAIRRAGIANLSLDLMFALPGQERRDWMASIEEALAYRPEHISFYGLTLHEGTPIARLAKQGRLLFPDEETEAGMYTEARRRLLDVGYEHYEISNFALPGYRARHNECYWMGGEWLALGPAAHAHYNGFRWANPASLIRWSRAVRDGRLPRSTPRAPTSEDLWAEGLILGLRRLDGLDVEALTQRSGRDLRQAGQIHLNRLLQAGLLEWKSADRLALTERGLLVADSVIAQLA